MKHWGAESFGSLHIGDPIFVIESNSLSHLWGNHIDIVERIQRLDGDNLLINSRYKVNALWKVQVTENCTLTSNKKSALWELNRRMEDDKKLLQEIMSL